MYNKTDRAVECFDKSNAMSIGFTNIDISSNGVQTSNELSPIEPFFQNVGVNDWCKGMKKVSGCSLFKNLRALRAILELVETGICTVQSTSCPSFLYSTYYLFTSDY